MGGLIWCRSAGLATVGPFRRVDSVGSRRQGAAAFSPPCGRCWVLGRFNRSLLPEKAACFLPCSFAPLARLTALSGALKRPAGFASSVAHAVRGERRNHEHHRHHPAD